ncbi:MAG: NAD-dependent epimerase/dehydratase family protein [Candidatus Nitrosotenuis sp.]
MKYVVTGGAGFIGSHLARFLADSGHSVVVIDNLHRGKAANIADIAGKVEFHKANILNFEDLEKMTKGADGIFHQAALTSVIESFEQTDKYYRVNVTGTENIFKIAKKYGIKVVYASSSSVYGNPAKTPITEDFERKPINPYGMTKLENEKLAEKFAGSGAKIIGMRYFNVYGPGQTPDYAGVITKFYDNITKNKPPVIFGDGSQIRDFVSVIDVAKANLMAMQSNLGFGFLNIGTGVATSIKSLADIMIRLSGKALEPIYDKLPEGDVRASQADIRLAKKLISWTADTNLSDGLKNFFF